MRVCAFCPNRANSKEHIWPEWIYKEFSESGEPRKISWWKNKGNVIHSENGPNSAIQSKVVCKTCNESWMSDLENMAKPLLLPLFHDKPQTISQDQANIITRWGIKTAMMLDCLHKDEPRLFTDAQYVYLKDNLTPLPRCYVFLGRILPGRNVVRSFRCHQPFQNDKSVGVFIQSHTTWLIVNYLVIQVVTFGASLASVPIRIQNLNIELGGDLVSVCPLGKGRATAAWPPSMTIPGLPAQVRKIDSLFS